LISCTQTTKFKFTDANQRSCNQSIFDERGGPEKKKIKSKRNGRQPTSQLSLVISVSSPSWLPWRLAEGVVSSLQSSVSISTSEKFRPFTCGTTDDDSVRLFGIVNYTRLGDGKVGAPRTDDRNVN
jgi:hypothetical protein